MKDYQVYTVGGFVRDKLLGRDPKDIDYVVVGSTPEKMLAMGFRQVGADFPVFLNERGEEFALARTERKTGDGYLGFATETAGVTIEDDLARRDLTINAMAEAEDGTIIDPFGGREDLRLKVLRHVSVAFAEDPLRVVRLARFYARYSDFTVANPTRYMATALVERGDLNHLSVERFWAELKKVFTEDQPDRFFSFLDTVNAFKHVHFFADLYGDSAASLKWATAVKNVDIEDPVMYHTALSAKTGPVLRTADTRTQVLHTHLNYVRKMDRTLDDLYRLLKAAKAWGSGSGMQDLCNVMVIAQTLGEKHAFGAMELGHALNCTADISAADFNLPQGKELGAAIERARKQVLSQALNLPLAV